MKRRWHRWQLTVAILCMGPSAGADIRDTGHNLARISPGAGTDPGATCVFCHTPLVSDTGSNAAPGWQSALPRGFTFDALESITGSGRAPGPPSLVCLSCHDANQARAAADPRQDHPFGVPFRGWPGNGSGAEVRRFVAPLRGDSGLNLDYRLGRDGRIDDRLVWWIATGPGLRRTRTDLPLYGRPGPGGEEVPYIECASCHDPHTTSRLFLRVTNEGSRLCLSCHVL